MSGYYLILMFGSSAALWGVPERYPDAAQCEAAGRGYRVATRGQFHCLPAPVIAGEAVNRRFKRDAYPVLECHVPGGKAAPDGTSVCGK